MIENVQNAGGKASVHFDNAILIRMLLNENRFDIMPFSGCAMLFFLMFSPTSISFQR